jgi:hypothetical protein
MGIQVVAPGPVDALAPQASLLNYGKATGPSAFAIIASITPTIPGIYNVKIHPGLSGTVAPADQDNIFLAVNGAGQITLILSAAITSGDVQPVQEMNINWTAGLIEVQTGAAATGTAIYSCLLVATRIG